jgi:hypothetical protein
MIGDALNTVEVGEEKIIVYIAEQTIGGRAGETRKDAV